MYKFSSIFSLLLFVSVIACAQDSLYNKNIAADQIKALKDGALVVRLKTYDRSIAAYRKTGRNDIADKIAQDGKARNLKIVDAFRFAFSFCKVYFIYSKNTDELLTGDNDTFLDDSLMPDRTIRMKEKYFLIAEYGSFTDNLRDDEYHYSGVHSTSAANTPASTSAIVILDTSLIQLKEPFPFYSAVYLDGYIKAVEALDRGLDKFYNKVLYREEGQNIKKKYGSNPSNGKF